MQEVVLEVVVEPVKMVVHQKEVLMVERCLPMFLTRDVYLPLKQR